MRRAFTLIEILVVLAIIGILAALLFPAFGRVRENGRAITCASNLKQVGLGLQQYAGDWDNFYPTSGSTVAWDALDSTTKRAGWAQQVFPYLKSKQILKCPSDSASDFSYFMSCRAAYLENSGFGAIQASRIVYPDKFVLAGDTLGFEVTDADKDDYTQNCVGGAANGSPWVEWRRHNGAQNILFSDGHVKRFAAFNAGLMTFDYTTMKAWP